MTTRLVTCLVVLTAVQCVMTAASFPLPAPLSSWIPVAAAAEGALIEASFDSALLGRKVALNVWTPPGYGEDDTRYPVLYLLHGAGGSQAEWVRQGGIGVTMDSLLNRGQIAPWIVVMPSLGANTWWVDGAVDPAESAFVQELMPWIDKRLRTRTDKAGRAIAGQSMGGYGALMLSLSHPEMFCAAALLSPAAYDPQPPKGSAARSSGQFRVDGAFNEAAWTRLGYAPRLKSYAAQKERVPLWIVSGDEDHLGIAPNSAVLYWRLHDVQPSDVELRVVEGDHDWLLFREAMTEAMQYIDRKCLEPDETAARRRRGPPKVSTGS